MRTADTRPARRRRPNVDAMEQRNLVSSLLFSGPGVAGGPPPPAAARRAPDDAPSSARAMRVVPAPTIRPLAAATGAGAGLANRPPAPTQPDPDPGSSGPPLLPLLANAGRAAADQPATPPIAAPPRPAGASTAAAARGGAIRPLALTAPPAGGAAAGAGAATATAPTGGDSTRSAATVAPTGGDSARSAVAAPAYGSPGPTTPTITYSGVDLIGGQARATIAAPPGKTITSVTWQISGAELDQSYTNVQGKTTDLPSPYVVNGGGGSAGLTFYWNATDGDHTIGATATYDDGTSGAAAPLTETVLKPTVNSFTIDYTKNAWGAIAGGNAGFRLDSPGMVYHATVTLPNNAVASANFGFIQLASCNDTQDNAVSGHHVINTGGFVLDNDPGMTNPGDPGYLLDNWTSPLMTAGKAVSTPPAPNELTDAPQTRYAQKSGTPTTDWSLELKINDQFVTYLAYHPNPGIWVGLQVTPAFTMGGDATYDMTNNKWNITGVTPAQGGTLTGMASQQFITWTNFATASFSWNPPY